MALLHLDLQGFFLLNVQMCLFLGEMLHCCTAFSLLFGCSKSSAPRAAHSPLIEAAVGNWVMVGQVGTGDSLQVRCGQVFSTEGKVERLLSLGYTQFLQCRFLFKNYHLIKVCCNSGSISSISGC